MTYNVFGGTLIPVQSMLVSCHIHCYMSLCYKCILCALTVTYVILQWLSCANFLLCSNNRSTEIVSLLPTAIGQMMHNWQCDMLMYSESQF